MAPQYSKTNKRQSQLFLSPTYHFNKYLIFSIFYFKFYSFLSQESFKFYLNSFLPNPADYMISVLDIPKGNFSFFSNKVLTDTDVAVYFKLGSSQQFRPKISVVLLEKE